ncbi:uncharacterized protein PFL1_00144 [Pseudozyma flocculosa PF-1]|uniref:Nascent polypeptide-associated complex subunit alpha-like UBA domain-containing protein n=1 Tax=Pseudozyma flocculosa TaxID=84751 RepID=A0A5C3ESX6_9BASI|nr:uncharacterized protein PFL1_00144 [Pseudozyma flocculosa PF-1]EPQ31945.1 hypothetical protein PFL1_00144 [Pseudozyma flocculosa PF-1]SPO35142.1 uncharacterized protein PSFLO_00613 [Pseudozyma flocculosa]
MSKPQAEVIQEWADADSDGYTFERGRMEKNVQAICFGDNAAVLPASIAQGPSAGLKLKKEDVDLLTNQLLLSRPAAEAALAKNGGDLEKTLADVVMPPPDW